MPHASYEMKEPDEVNRVFDGLTRLDLDNQLPRLQSR